MIFTNRGLSKEKIKDISAGFKKALATGAIFATVAFSGLSLTGCGATVGATAKEVKEESKPQEYIATIHPETSYEQSKSSYMSDFKYVVDDNTGVVYIDYHRHAGANASASLSVAFMFDEETKELRPMTRDDLEKMIEKQMMEDAMEVEKQ